MSARLPRAALPSDIVTLDAWPLTARGKLDYAVLEIKARDRAVEEQSHSSGMAQPRDSTIKAVARIVHEVLVPATERLATDHDLFTIGATSVDVTRILNRIDRGFGVRPSIDDVFANMSIAGIAHLVGAASSTAQDHPPRSPAPDIDDPEERERFRAASAVRRNSLLASSPAIVSLAPPTHQAHARLRARRSERSYAAEPVPFIGFSHMLGLLSVCEDDRRRHASSGGLYALDAFVFVRQGPIADLPGGTYFYDPNEHQLAAIEIGCDLDALAYDRLKNRPLFTACAFALYLVAAEAAIAPLYGARAHDLLLLDAGYVGQLLQSAAHEFGIGLCPIGSLDFRLVRGAFRLSEDRHLVHSFVGGAPARAAGPHP